MKEIKWGILGAGNIASTFAADINLVEGCSIEAVASRDMSRAENFAKKFDALKAYDSYEALAKDPQVDVVYIATPHSFHKEQSILCMRHQKAVLCEKPMATNLEDLLEMVAVAKEEKVFLMEAMWTRFRPIAVKLRQLLEAHYIGDVRFVQSDFGFMLPEDFDPKSRLLNKDLAGGALLDVGVYPIAMSHMVLGMPDRMTGTQIMGPTDVDLQTMGMLTYDSGASAVIHCAINADTQWETFISGSKGQIKIPSTWFESTIEWTNEAGEKTSKKFDLWGNDYTHEIQGVAEALRKGQLEHPVMTHQDSIDIMTIMDQLKTRG